MPIVGALPFTLQNGTVADATQVMADFSSIKTDVNGNAAANGANNDITSLAGLTTPLSVAQGGTAFTTTEQVFVRGYLWGLALSNDSGGTTALAVAAGACRDSTNVDIMIRASALTGKVLANAWTVGNGGGLLDTGSIGNNWYYIYLIKRVDTGVVDAIASLSVSAPTLPANYTLYRRIGSIQRVAGAIVLFTQFEDRIILTTAIKDATGTTAVTPTLVVLGSIPLGLNVKALLRAGVFNAAVLAAYASVLVQSPVETGDDGGLSGGNPGNAVAFLGPDNTGWGSSGEVNVVVDTSARVRVSGITNAGSYLIMTYGWEDTRERFGP